MFFKNLCALDECSLCTGIVKYGTPLVNLTLTFSSISIVVGSKKKMRDIR